jgi:hypothetical protein
VWLCGSYCAGDCLCDLQENHALSSLAVYLTFALFFVLFCFVSFLWFILNSGPHECQPGTLPLEPLYSHTFALGKARMVIQEHIEHRHTPITLNFIDSALWIYTTYHFLRVEECILSYRLTQYLWAPFLDTKLSTLHVLS